MSVTIILQPLAPASAEQRVGEAAKQDVHAAGLATGHGFYGTS